MDDVHVWATVARAMALAASADSPAKAKNNVVPFFALSLIATHEYIKSEMAMALIPGSSSPPTQPLGLDLFDELKDKAFWLYTEDPGLPGTLSKCR